MEEQTIVLETKTPKDLARLFVWLEDKLKGLPDDLDVSMGYCNIDTYSFEINGITKDTYEDIVAHVQLLNPELEFTGGVE